MHKVNLTEDQMERLRIANETKKWGHLETWGELYVFQRTIANGEQLKAIAEIAKRHRDLKEVITLPYMNHGKQEYLLPIQKP
jgi:hypothetical protein